MNSLDGAAFDRDRFYLGSLCKRGHDWQGTGQGLRQKSNGGCVACVKGRVRDKEKLRLQKERYYKENRDRLIEASKAYWESHREETKAKKRKHRADNAERINRERREFRAANGDLVREKDRITFLGVKGERQRAFYQKNRIRILAETKKRQQRPESILSSRASCARRRARKANASGVPPTVSDIELLKEKCNHQCVYCGSNLNLSVEHFIALSVGGSHCVGNLLIACMSCNSSKSSKDPYQWFQSRPTFSPKRWKFILKLLGKTQENYNQIPLL